MRILDAEMDLRDETRALEQAHDGLEASVYDDRAQTLSKTQDELATRLIDVVVDIMTLEDGEKKFAKEINIIQAAAVVATEATQILASPNTGPQAVGAETEIIELLLQSKRANPNGGGGGGSSPGGGGQGDTDQPALALYGPGGDLQASVQKREVRQSVGSSASELPAEYRDGLDAFFNAVESLQ